MESVSVMRFVRRLLAMLLFIKYCKEKRLMVFLRIQRVFYYRIFDNELINSVGVPVKHGDKQYALFIRPDIQNQFGEMRIFLAVLLGFIVLLSIIFIAIAAGYIVRPIRKFTKATQKLRVGNIKLN